MSTAGLIVTQTAAGTRSTSGGRMYPASATDPSSPTPADGDLYYNTAINELCVYDGSRSKWLSITAYSIQSGRNGNTVAGAFYRGVDGMVLDATNQAIPCPKGTIVSIALTRSDTGAATLDVLNNGSSVATLAHSTAGATRNDAVNVDVAAGRLSFQNQAGGSATSNVQIVILIKRRV